ncbi:MAG: phosphofructokinase [Desulfobacterales bacterium]|nr:phosphofructokinase [Desulfobacterales bacterium]
MTRQFISVEELFKNKSVDKAINNVSQEVYERRRYKPAKCDAFKNDFTFLEEAPQYPFKIDREAEKKLPAIIGNNVQQVIGSNDSNSTDKEKFVKLRKIGVVFSGGPAPGGHNVIAGIFDAAKNANPENKIFGFLLGPDGIIENETIEITKEIVDKYRNLGGFSMIKTGRTKIDSDRKKKFSKETCQNLGLDAIVIVGGDDSNTNAAFLAQDLYDSNIQVIGVPKTIDGDLQVKSDDGTILCAMSFGFHTAARAFSENISNLCTDCNSDIKYWHICKVMGRVASHLALEVSLQTHPNITLIGEDLADYTDTKRLEKAEKEGVVDYSAYGMTLRHLSRLICKSIVKRAAVGKNYGVIIIPEGILEFINEIQVFITKLNTIIANYNDTHDTNFHTKFHGLDEKLEFLRRLEREQNSFSIWNSRDNGLFNDIPDFFKEGLLIERDSHGNFQFSQIDTDKIIMNLVQDYLNILKEKGIYKKGIKKSYFIKFLESDGVDPSIYGPVLFDNFDEKQNDEYMVMKKEIMSKKTLRKTFERSLGEEQIPEPVLGIYEKSIPKFSTQSHFYGYDGRGSDPTKFDCKYTYNLGMTVFSLIAGGSTGQMAAIRNLEKGFELWEPIGIPIAPLMHLEDRGGKLSLVIEKSIVDLNSNAFRVVKEMRNTWLGANPGLDHFRKSGPIRFTGNIEEDRPITLVLNSIGA